jgi:hypothetical protein
MSTSSIHSKRSTRNSRNRKKRPTVRPGPRADREDLVVKCLDCKFRRKTGNYDADRVAGRRHAEAEGHVVQATRKSVITWDGRK